MLLVAVGMAIALAILLPSYYNKAKVLVPPSVKDTGLPAWTATMDDIGKLLVIFSLQRTFFSDILNPRYYYTV